MNLQNLKNSQKTFLDVRTAEEYAEGHVPGAINIPLNQMQKRLDEVKNVPKPVVVYCFSGSRSAMATNILKVAGIREVIDGGGISNVMQPIG